MNKGRNYKRRSQLAGNTGRYYRPTHRHVQQFSLFRLRWLLILLLTVPIASYTIALDADVREQFEGKRWALPAKVYARPLELYPEMDLKIADLEHELQTIGYRQDEDANQEGEYYRRGNEVSIVTRAFTFWDTSEPSRNIRLRFKNDRLIQIADMERQQGMQLLRLDPVMIGKIYPAHKEDRELVQLSEVPPLLIQALIAVEDRMFYEHNGVSVRGTARAMVANLRAGTWVQGGSTVTQQLIKNYYLSPERTLTRKVNEAMMAVLLEWHYEKEQILQAYLNEVFLGQAGRYSIHGMGMAARFYFDRPLDQLELPEIALLVGMIRGPSRYNPRRYPERALERRNMVLKLMMEQGVITEEQRNAARDTPLNVSKEAQRTDSKYPAFLQLVRQQLREDYREEDLRSEGLQIFTTLDPMLQYQAETSLQDRIKRLEKENRQLRLTNKLEGALVVTNTENGEVVAVVGGRKPRFAGFNRAIDAVRPIGSLIKPAVYLTALENSQAYSLISTLNDKPFSWQDKYTGETWKPKNYDGRVHGRVSLYKALGQSYNLATVHLGFELGLSNIQKTLKRMGLERDFDVYPATLLGGLSLSPFEVAQMYQTIASGGFRVPLRAIRNVTTHDGQPLNRYALSVEQRFDPAAIYVLNYALQGVVRYGTGRYTASQDLPKEQRAAGKTGTTNDYRDSWFAGFSGNYLAISWLGRDDNQPIGLTGSNGAMRVWADFMRNSNAQNAETPVPNRIRWQRVDNRNGRLSNQLGSYVNIPVIVDRNSMAALNID